MTTSADNWTTVTTHDGGTMPAFIARPASGGGPGLVLLQEIFGITEYIQSRARDLANLGYVVLVPELYWRMGPHISTDETTETGLQDAFGHFQKLDVPVAIDDAVAALESLKGMPETGGRAGVIGFCLGGLLAYAVGTNSTPDVVVSYYGSGIADRLDAASDINCPIMFHFGGADQFLPIDQSDRIAAAFANRDAAEVHVQPGAGHAFDNFRAPIFYHADASAASWPLTTDFLARHFPS